MSGIPIFEPTNAIFHSKSNPAEKSKRKKKSYSESPFDRRNDRNRNSFPQYSKSPYFQPNNSASVSRLPSVNLSSPLPSGESLLTKGLDKFKGEKQISLQGQAAIFRQQGLPEAINNSRPTTSHGRQAAPKLQFQSGSSNNIDNSDFYHKKIPARDRMQPKSASSTPRQRSAAFSCYVDKVWCQAVGSEDKHVICLPNDARIEFYNDFVDLNFRHDSPFRSKDVREVRYSAEDPYAYILFVLTGGDKLWIQAMGDHDSITRNFFEPGKLGLLTDEENNVFTQLCNLSRRQSGRVKPKSQNTELLKTLKSNRDSKGLNNPEQTQLSHFYASKRATRSNSVALFNSEDYEAPRELRKRKASPKPINLVPQPLTNNEIFKYPLRIDKFAISVREHDRHRMNEGEFLNDTAIEFYIRYLQNDGIYDFKWKAFSSFFYSQYTSDPSTGLYTDRGTYYNYDKVKKWTAKDDIFENEFIFVPINEHLHWYLGVIWNPGSLLIEKVPLSQFQEYEIVPITSGIKSKIAAKYNAEVINLGDEEREDFYGKVEGGGSFHNHAAAQQIDISDTEDDKDPLIGNAHNSHPISNTEDTVLDDNGFESLTDPDTPQALNSLKSTSRARSDAVSPDLCAKTSAIKSRITPVTGTMKRTEKKRREEKLRQTQEDRLNRRKEKYRVSDVRCIVMIIDSLGVKRIRPTRVLRNYLCEELYTKHKIKVDPESKIHFDSIPDAKTPFQPNHCDCGVYLLQAIETIVKNPDKYRDYLLSGKDVPSEWFAHDDIVLKRRMIMSLMDKLEKEYIDMNARRGSPSSFESISGPMDVDSPAVVSPSDDDVEIIE